MRLTVLGKSPSWQDAGGACSGYLLQEGDTTVLLDCGNGVFGKLRQFVRLRGRGRRRALAPARGPLPRPRARSPTRSPTRRASSRCRCPPGRAPTTRPGPRLIAPPGARETLPPGRGRVGQRGPDRERVRARGVRGRLDARGRAAALRVPGGAALHPDLRRPRSTANGGGRWSTAPTPAQRGARGVRQGLRPAAHRGHPAAPRAHRECADT